MVSGESWDSGVLSVGASEGASDAGLKQQKGGRGTVRLGGSNADTFCLGTVYPTGLVCISILHAPGDDPNHYEQASERWSPIQSVEKILISVMSMLAEPNDESPANVDAARLWREKRGEYEKRVRGDVRRALGL